MDLLRSPSGPPRSQAFARPASDLGNAHWSEPPLRRAGVSPGRLGCLDIRCWMSLSDISVPFTWIHLDSLGSAPIDRPVSRYPPARSPTLTAPRQITLSPRHIPAPRTPHILQPPRRWLRCWWMPVPFGRVCHPTTNSPQAPAPNPSQLKMSKIRNPPDPASKSETETAAPGAAPCRSA